MISLRPECIAVRDGETTIKINFAFFGKGGGGGGVGCREENRPETLFFLGKRHDIKKRIESANVIVEKFSGWHKPCFLGVSKGGFL